MHAYLKPTAILLSDLNVLSVVKTQYQFNETIQQQFATVDEDCNAQGDLQFSFLTGGLTPSGDGTLTCTAIGDLDDGPDGGYTINFEGTDLSPVVGGNAGECDVAATEVYNIPLASLQAAAANGTIVVTAVPGPEIGCFCILADGGNQVTCTLEFPAS